MVRTAFIIMVTRLGASAVTILAYPWNRVFSRMVLLL